MLGHGTKFCIKIPMVQANTSGTSSSTTTPSTNGTDQSKDDSVTAVRKLTEGKRCAIYRQTAFSPEVLLPRYECASKIQNKLATYVSAWCGLTLTELSSDKSIDIVITDESELPAYLEVRQNLACPILVLCSNASRHTLLKTYAHIKQVELMSKPFGPYKLARALQVCLERNTTSHADRAVQVDQIEHPLPTIDEVTMTARDGEQVTVFEVGGISAKADSTHADLMMASASESSHSNHDMSEAKEYPFDSNLRENMSPGIAELVASPNLSGRPDLRNRRTMSPTLSEIRSFERSAAMDTNVKFMTSAGLNATTPAAAPRSAPTMDMPVQSVPSSASPLGTRQPRLLLVDDNHINLRLLQTFMRKRKYSDIHSARDGQEAVEVFTEQINVGKSPDIIFMDISMPRMNGFEATKAIRACEARFAENILDPMARPASSLIIALTGLASGKDQSEAFLAGVDLYMTKPVSFKEVGRLLDNFEANKLVREVGEQGGVEAGEKKAADDEHGVAP
jgi:CheY-like chemotaxis protein